MRWSRAVAHSRRSLTAVCVGAALVQVAGAGEALAQSDRFVRALTAFQNAADGMYGDEGPELRAYVDEMGRALAAWYAASRQAEGSVLAEIQTASTQSVGPLYVRLGSLYLQRNRFEDALEAFESGSQVAPDDPTMHLFRGMVLEVLGRAREAGEAFERSFAQQPGNPITAYLTLAAAPAGADVERAHTALATLARGVTRGEIGRAATPFVDLSVFSNRSDGLPEFVPHRYAGGFDLHARGRHEDAVERLRDAVAGDPLVMDLASGSGVLQAAAAALRLGNVAVALDGLEKAVETSPGSAEVHRILATVHELAGDPEKGVHHAEEALRLRPDDDRAWVALARIHTRAGALVEAAETLDRAVQVLPESAELHWRLAGLSLQVARSGEALAAYDAASGLPVVSGRGELFKGIADLSMLHQDLPRAVAAAEQRVRLLRNDPAAHRELAILYRNDGRHEQAFAEIAVAAWLDPDNPFTFVALGQTHLELGRVGDAVDALTRAVSLHPDLAEARYALAQALVRAGRRAESPEHLVEFQRLRAISMDRERRSYQVAGISRAARLHAQDGQHELAAQAYRELIALEPRVARHYLDLAQALEDTGLLEESLEALVLAADLDGVAEVHLRIANVLSRLGRLAESARARETYEWLRLEDLERRTRR